MSIYHLISYDEDDDNMMTSIKIENHYEVNINLIILFLDSVSLKNGVQYCLDPSMKKVQRLLTRLM